MAYAKQNFVDGQVLKAEHLNHIEEGIANPFNYADFGLPLLVLTGDTSMMTKDNEVGLNYVYGDKSGTCTMKWQGSSSLAYPKKNYTIKFDNAFEAKSGWGEQKKYCLKANYIDHSQARNVVSCKLWGQSVKKREFLDNLFVLSKITGLVTTWEGTATISDGVLTNGASIKYTGQACFTGISFPAGTYNISFEVCSDTEGVWEQLYTGFMKQEHGGSVFATRIIELNNSYPGTPINTWVKCAIPNVSISEEAGFYLQAASNVNPTAYKFRNIEICSTTGLSRIAGLPNGGAVDGFPVIITLNGGFHGLYTFNIPKDGWMLGMGDGTQEAIVCADAWVNATGFKAPATLNGDFELEYVTDEDDVDWVLTSLNTLINACINSDGTDLDTTVAQYLDWDSAIDYYIHTVLERAADATNKNYLLATYDGVKWFFTAYDRDSTYGLYWDGTQILTASTWTTFAEYASMNRVMELVYTYKKNELKARYKQLRASVMSEYNVALTFENFCKDIPAPIYDKDVETWTKIPSSAVTDVRQILDWYRKRIAVIDSEIGGSYDPVESAEYPGCYYRMVNGVQEWINPPMVLGTHYKTTERWKGKAVWVFAYNVGTLPNATTGTWYLGITAAQAVELQVYGMSGGTHLKLPSKSTAFWLSSDGTFALQSTSDLSAYTGTLIIKYTKD